MENQLPLKYWEEGSTANTATASMTTGSWGAKNENPESTQIKMASKNHQVGDRVMVLHNIPLGNLFGTINAIHERPRHDVYEVELDGGGTDQLYDFQLQTLPDDSQQNSQDQALR